MLHHHLEAMLRSGKYEEVLAQAEAYFQSRSAGEEKEAVWVAAWGCRSANRLERWGQVIAWADRGLRIAGPHPEAEGVLRFTVAKALMHTGDLLRAERELRRFLMLAEQLPALRKALPDGLYNLAHLQRWLRRTQDSLRLFREAAAAYQAQGQRHQVAQCHLEIGWSHLLAGGLAEAESELDQARALGADRNTELEGDMAIASALYCHLAGDTVQSDQICMETGSLLPRQAGEVAWILGKNALARGDLMRAAEYLAVAHDAAVELWWPPLLERVEELRGALVARGVPAQ